MSSSTTLGQGSAQSSHVLYMFRGSMGKLQRQLCKGEFAMFQHIPMFESDFIQVSKRGEVIDVLNYVQMVTVGIAYTSPDLIIPDVMLLAHPAVSGAVGAKQDGHTQGRRAKKVKSLELTRLLPLKLVKLSIYSHEKKQLHLKLATGRSFYLQLCPPSNTKEDVFEHWEDLVFFLRPPMEAYSGTQGVPAWDMMNIPVLEAEDRKSPAAMELHGEGDQGPTSVRSLSIVAEMSGATSIAYAGGEGVQQPASCKNSMLSDTMSFLTPELAGPDQEALPGAAEGTPKGRVSVDAGGEMTGRPVTETLEGPEAEPFISARQSQENISEQNGGQRVSQSQAEALRKIKEKKKSPTKRSFHSGRKWEDKSILRSHGNTPGDQKEEGRSSPGGQGHDSSHQEYNSFSITPKGSRSSQNLSRN